MNEQRVLSNRRNGRQSKMIRSESGEVEIVYHRDRNSTFDPITIKKRQHQLGVGFDNQILELYAMSNSIADIRTKIRRKDGVASVALYVIYGISVEDKREIVALYPGQGAEGASEWRRCLQDLKNRGLEDILIICSDGLSGLKEVMQEAFPMARIQRCVVHKIRNCFKFIDSKDQKQVLRQLKDVYHAVNEPAARQALEDLGRRWDGKYDIIVQMWEKDWDELMAYMDLPIALRKITYTTNAIENLNREIRRVTKTKGAWVSDKALLIQLFLSLDRNKKNWNKKVHQWATIRRELFALEEKETQWVS